MEHTRGLGIGLWLSIYYIYTHFSLSLLQIAIHVLYKRVETTKESILTHTYMRTKITHIAYRPLHTYTVQLY